jgi:putative addiction module killer protein
VNEIRQYTTASGKNLVESWLGSLRDTRIAARIEARLERLVAGNFGDCKPVGAGVSELRIDIGPGYRIYYAMIGTACVLLLYGGDKRRQSADIAKAIEYLKDYKLRRTMP